MFHKKNLYIGLIVVLLISGLVIWQRSRPVANSPVIRSDSNEQVNEQTQSPVPEGGEEFNAVSLPALMQKQFDGRDLKLGQVLDDNPSYTRYFITYKSGELTISGIMNVPKGSGPFPLLILNHGFIEPSIYTNGRGLRREQDYLARHGYTVLHSDYRNHAQSDKDPDSDVHFRLGYVEDVINAVYAVKNSNLPALAVVDKDNVGMLGHSMGGGVTINALVVQPDLIKAAVLFAPVSANQEDNFHRWLERRPETAQKIIEQFGRPEDSPDFWHDISAQNFFDRLKTPVLLHHGTADESVPIEWSDRLSQQLKAAGKSIDYRVYPGQPHEFTTAWPEVMQTTVDFFDQHLK